MLQGASQIPQDFTREKEKKKKKQKRKPPPPPPPQQQQQQQQFVELLSPFARRCVGPTFFSLKV